MRPVLFWGSLERQSERSWLWEAMFTSRKSKARVTHDQQFITQEVFPVGVVV